MKTKLQQTIDSNFPYISVDWRLFSFADPLWRVSVEHRYCGKLEFLNPTQLQNFVGCVDCTNFIEAKSHNKAAMRNDFFESQTMLYYVYFDDYDTYKIGITCNSVQRRFAHIKNKTTIFSKIFPNRWSALKAEKEILYKYNDKQYKGPDFLRGGITECFSEDIFASFSRDVSFTDILENK